MVRCASCIGIAAALSLAGCSEQPTQVVLDVDRSQCSCPSARLGFAVLRQPRPGATCLVRSATAEATSAPTMDLSLPKGTVLEVVLYATCGQAVDGGSRQDGALIRRDAAVRDSAPLDSLLRLDTAPSCPRSRETATCCRSLKECLTNASSSNPDCRSAAHACCEAAHLPSGGKRYYDRHCWWAALTPIEGGRRIAAAASSGGCKSCLGQVKIGLGWTTSTRLVLKSVSSCSPFRSPPPCE